jgi:23S rRNA pseudouridine1911/1915/1917 synthase
MHLLPEPIELPTLFEDNRLWIINKPMGMVVHPGPGHPSGTVLNALLARIGVNVPTNGIAVDEDDEESQSWPGLVHRLDRYTSGCMAMAKDEKAKECLQAQFKARTVEKTYLALARHSRKLPEIGSLLIDVPIARHRLDRTKMTIQSKGKSAQTRVKVLGKCKGLALVSCDILTGRTHQIRVHLASLGAPLLGDPLYGGATAWQGPDSSPIECPHPALHS